MKNPTKEQVQLIIDTFESVKELSNKECRVNMMEGCLDTSCGSPMCHGGWYAVARLDLYSKKTTRDFVSGANKMAKDLGFKNEGELVQWARNNPMIWGNTEGALMFTFDTAFKAEEDWKYSYLFRVTNLSQIIDHWKRVQTKL